MPTVRRLKDPYSKPSEGRGIGQGRTNPNREIYDSWRWKKLAQQVRKNEPICRACKAEGRIVPAKVTDHIVSVNKGGDPWDLDNLQPLCITCHNKKSSEEGRL